ncbi:MAG: hypothetical protein K1X79_09680 [Oligoflexia bacterium]|nr:hypothetical protein [Oligoflexia bacterium]
MIAAEISPMFKVLLPFLAAVALVGCGGGGGGDNNPPQNPPEYDVVITSALPLAPRTALCGYAVEHGTSNPAPNVSIVLDPPGGLPLANVFTDANGNFCTNPAGFFGDIAGEVFVYVDDGNGGNSDTVSVLISPYTRDILLSSDCWGNGDTVALRVEDVSNGQFRPFEIKIWDKDGNLIDTVNGGAGLAFRQNQLVDGVYDLQGRDTGTGEFTPIRRVASLKSFEPALGASVARQLDSLGNALPLSQSREWDGDDGVPRDIGIATYISQSTHLGGTLYAQDPDGFVLTSPIAPGASTVGWQPDLPGVWFVQVEINLPTPGLTTSEWRPVLVFPAP